MAPEEAADLATRTLAAIDDMSSHGYLYEQPTFAADRERVNSDLAGLRNHSAFGPKPLCSLDHDIWPCSDAARYSAGLLRTAALYGVAP